MITTRPSLSTSTRATDTPAATAPLTVNSGFTLIENLAWHRGASTGGGHIALTGTSTTLAALGTVINNNLFRFYAAATEGAIYNLDNWFITVYNSMFHNCETGINMIGSNSTMRRTMVRNCIFKTQTAASVTNNIYYAGSSGQDNTIMDCDFVGEVPTATDGPSSTAGCIYAAAAIQGTVVRCTYADDSVEGTAAAAITANGLSQVDCAQAKWTADAGSGGLEGS